MGYAIKLHPDAAKEFLSLDKSVQVLVKKQLEKLKTAPHLGAELGNKHGSDLSGYRKMYACKKQIRIVYSVDESIVTVFVIAIGKRNDFEVYRDASSRI